MSSVWLLVIISIYFAVLLGIAFYTSRNSSNESFFIGDRSSKWWLVAFGMIGTSLSGMTFISVPGTVGSMDATGTPAGFGYFQVVIGYWLGYFIVAFVLLPLYYRLHLTSIYSYLDQRLGQVSYRTGALFFILSRTLGATLRLYLVIKVLEKFILQDLGISFEATAVLILVLILLYTIRGGVKTIVWTDTLQTTCMLGALIICVGYIMHHLNLGAGESWRALGAQHYTSVLQTDDWLKGNYFVKQILGGAFITIAMTGLDQEMMQKNISVSNLRDSKKNMISFCFIMLAANFLFLVLGGLLHLYAINKGAHYASVAGATGTQWQFLLGGSNVGGDNLFPTFAISPALPFFITICFIIGLISAVFPSADGALTALTASFCIDILDLKRRDDWSERKRTRVRLAVHYTFSAVFLICIFFFRKVDNGSLIRTLLIVAGYTYGPLLALFTFGICTRRQLRDGLVPLACLASPVICYIVKQHDGSHGADSWLGGYVIDSELLILNAALTFAFLWLLSYAPKANREPALT